MDAGNHFKRGVNRKAKRVGINQKNDSMGIISMKFRSLILAVALGSLVLAGCTKEEQQPVSQAAKGDVKSIDFLNDYEGLDPMTVWELQQATAATARYKHIKNAYKDGYASINVVVQGMGYHFMKSTLVDGTFDFRNPEILVYNLDEAGEYHLVAVEYAVPLALSPEAPDGFTGDDDVWSANTEVGLWLLHAWVWEYNPLGVFNPVNPNVVVLELL